MQPEVYSGAKRIWPTFLWALVAFCLFGLLAIVAVRYCGKFETYPGKRAKDRAERLAKLRAEEHEKLETYGWVDKATGVAHLPADRAMELALAELSRKEVKASAVAVPVPGQPATPAAATPAPAAVPAGAVPAAVVVPASPSTTEAAPAAQDDETKTRPNRRKKRAANE